MPTSYSDIAVVTSPKIQITDERIEIVESTLLELKPFIEGMNSHSTTSFILDGYKKALSR